MYLPCSLVLIGLVNIKLFKLYHFGTVLVRSKLPTQHVRVSPSPVSREASRDLWRSIGLSTMVVFKTANVTVSASTMSANIMDNFIFMFEAKRALYFQRFRLNERAETGVSDQRGRRKTAVLNTSGVKRAKTWRGGVQWSELAIGMAVASGGETERGEK